MPEEGDPTDFKSLIAAIKQVKPADDRARPIERAIDELTLSDKEWVDVVLELVKIPHKDLLDKAVRLVDSKIKFKAVPNGLVQIITQLKKMPDFSGIKLEKLDSIYSKYNKLCDEIDDFNKIVAGKNAAGVACELLILAVTDYHPYYTACAGGLEELATMGFKKASPADQLKFVEGLKAIYSKNLDGKILKEDRELWSIQQDNSYRYKAIIPDAEHKKAIDELYSLFHMLGTKEENFTDDEGRLSEIGYAYYGIITGFLVEHCDNKEGLDYLKAFIPDCFEWKLRNKDELEEGIIDIQERAAMFLDRALSVRPDLAGTDNIDKMIQQFMKSQDYSEGANLWTMYQNDETTRPVIDKYAKELVSVCNKAKDDNTRSILMQLFWQMSQFNPAVLESSIDKLEPYVDDTNLTAMVALIFVNIAKNNAASFKGRGDKYLERTKKLNQLYYASGWFPLYERIASIDDKEAERSVAIMEAHNKSIKQDVTVGQVMLHNWTVIAQHHPEPVRKRIPYINELKKNPALKQQAQHLLDILEGRSLAKVADDIEQQQEDIDDLDNRVTQNEDDIDELDVRSKQQQKDLSQARNDIDTNAERVDDLEERVDIAEDDIIELDNKVSGAKSIYSQNHRIAVAFQTVSNAPAWSKEVSKLMNPTASNDYRLVAQRLGYSPSEIRGWAQQPDPTMSMLAEFYTTNKTSEATHFLLGVLREVNRPDVVRIIEKAQKDVEGVVQDKPQKYRKPPPVFLSYQWAHQDHIKLLKHYLEKEGFACWMDIGQMGGGDSLYEEIDEGIRASKVVVTCMSEKYCKSPNCIREVNLSNGLGKRIIPLQMEKISWPPPGSLGPIMAEKLFIRFYQRDNEKTNDERYWPPSMYKQLVDQIREKVEPDPDVIAEANGQKPPPKPKPAPQSKPAAAADKQRETAPSSDDKHPPIFISYQWKHQTEVKVLKEKLEKDGFHSWMDIGEMAGGDALYEPIDKGIRNATVVVICVNSKYPKSENCTKEVFLADGLKKKIIPILLEPMQWPPDGRQSRILGRFYPLPFFHGNKKGNTDPWPEQSYQGLLKKLQEAGISPGQMNKASAPAAHARKESPPQRRVTSPPKRKESPQEPQESPLQRRNDPPPAQRQRPPKGAGDRALSPIDRKRAYDLAISCSPDCTKDMVNLASSLRAQGYDATVATYTEDSVLSLKTNTVICALSARYSKSNMASNEVCQSIRMNHYVIPLVMDDGISYPPEGQMRRPLSHIRPIDCAGFSAGSGWAGTPQFDKIVNRLSKSPSRPTGGTNKNRYRSQSVGSLENARKVKDPANKDYDSTDDRSYAKSMQNGHKLPQLSSESRRTYGQGTDNPSSRILRENSSGNIPVRRRGYSDPDGPKLPSVYRQRFRAL